MNKSWRWVMAAGLLLMLAACGHSKSNDSVWGYDFNVAGTALVIRDGRVVVRPHGVKEARVGRDGRLTIGGKEVATDAAGRAALSKYANGVFEFQAEAKQLGVKSAHFALHTLGRVLHGLFHGDVDQVGEQADAGGQAIEQQALRLCGKLDDLRQVQQSAVAAVPQFAPYAVIKPTDVSSCKGNGHPKPEHQLAPTGTVV